MGSKNPNKKKSANPSSAVCAAFPISPLFRYSSTPDQIPFTVAITNVTGNLNIFPKAFAINPTPGILAINLVNLPKNSPTFLNRASNKATPPPPNSDANRVDKKPGPPPGAGGGLGPPPGPGPGPPSLISSSASIIL